MTENEAKTKWCHRANNGDDQSCIASGCMAWVWDNESGVVYRRNHGEGYRQMTKEEKSTTSAGKMGMDFIMEGEPTGRCGLIVENE